MRKLYYVAITAFSLLAFHVSAQNHVAQMGSVTFKLDNSKNDGKAIEAAYVVLDKYDLTGAGFIKERFDRKISAFRKWFIASNKKSGFSYGRE